MKNKLLIIVLLFATTLFGQQKFNADSVMAFRKELNADFANKDKSPLTAKDIKSFKKLDFFPVNESFFVNAQFVRTPNEKPFEMPTSSNRKPLYVKFGEAHFVLNGKKGKLNIYRNIELSTKEEYKNYLFLPFTDLTSGVESYGGGRYIDLKIPTGNVITIDFNKAYNPYCAYNHTYSCPIPPEENNLKIAIKAGVKKFH